MLGLFTDFFTRGRERAAACVVLALWPLAVWSGSPREEVNAAIDKLLTTRSYEATMVSADGRKLQQLEFVAPGRYRIRRAGTEQIVVGDVLYQERNGMRMEVPLPQDVLTQWRDPARLVEHAKDMGVTAAGDEPVAGTPARKYRISRSGSQPGPLTVWIGADGYPVQILATSAGESVPTLIRYARFNDPEIRIQPPK